jgi:putative aldouronate transport system substrate-binding protein
MEDDMKNIMIAVLMSFLALGMVYAGGNQTAGGGASGKASTAVISGLPLTKDNVTFTVFIGGGTKDWISSFDYKDNVFTKKVTDETGIKFEFIVTSAADHAERRNVMLSTGTYPDIIISRNGMTLGDIDYYAQQGVIIPLDDYNPLSYPNIKAAFDEVPAINQKVRGSDGKLYSLPEVNECVHCVFGNGRIWYYMPWVRDGYANKVPTTTAELLEYLRYVKTHDMNGNGNINDEIGIAFSKNNIENFFLYFAKPFLPFITSNWGFGITQENGKVVEQYRDNRFRDALRYMCTLYQEGLIAENSFSMTDDELKSLVQATTPVVALPAVAWINGVTTQPSERWIDHFSLTPIAGPSGQRYGGNNEQSSIVVPFYFVTDKCKRPDLAVALYNYLIDWEVSQNGLLGPKGVAWDDPEPGALGVTGKPALYRQLVGYGSSPLNVSWDQDALPSIRVARLYYHAMQAKGSVEAQKWLATGDLSLRDYLLNLPDYAEEMWYFTAKGHQDYAVPDSYFVPLFALSDSDTTRLSDINASLNPYREQALVEFITGVRDINSDAAWRTYLSELDRFGGKDKTDILQKYIK